MYNPFFYMILLVTVYFIIEIAYYGNMIGKIKPYQYSPTGNAFSPDIVFVSLVHGCMTWIVLDSFLCGILTILVYTLLFLVKYSNKKNIDKSLYIWTSVMILFQMSNSLLGVSFMMEVYTYGK